MTRYTETAVLHVLSLLSDLVVEDARHLGDPLVDEQVRVHIVLLGDILLEG